MCFALSVDDSEDALTSMRYTSAKGGGRHGSARGLPSPDQKTKHIVEMAANQQRREDSFFQWDHGSRPKVRSIVCTLNFYKDLFIFAENLL